MGRHLANLGFLIFLALTTSTGVAGQGRGRGGRPGMMAPNRAVAPAARGSVFVGRGPVVAPRQFVGPRVGIIHQPRVIVSQPYLGFYSPNFWGFPSYGPPAYYPEPSYTEPSVSQNEVELSYQVQRLSQEIEQLRQEQAAAAVLRQPPPYLQPPPPSTPERPAVPTTLVFRDGHRAVIQNYAIVGQTLWILDERTSTKVPLSELDLNATQSENRGQGVRFPLPE